VSIVSSLKRSLWGIRHECNFGLKQLRRGRASYLANVLAYRVLAIWPTLPGANKVCCLETTDGDVLYYRRNRGDLQGIREIYIDEIYSLPDGANPTSLVDFGANIGIATIWLSRRYGLHVSLSVEPVPENFALLQRNLLANNLFGQTLNAAIGASNGTVMFDGSFETNMGRMGAGTLEVTVHGVAQVVANLDFAPSLLKVDVEGAELPSFTMVPPRGDHPVHGHFWVPINDHSCWTWSFDYHPTRALTTAEVDAMKGGASIHVLVDKDYVPLQRMDNDYLMDRKAQREGSLYSGIEGIGMQDASLQESMGSIQDRTKENLVSTDNGIIMARQRLIKTARALAENPDFALPGLDPEHQKVRSVAMLIKRDVHYKEGAKEHFKSAPGKPHSSV
jgi:FkbM family methyltransferase